MTSDVEARLRELVRVVRAQTDRRWARQLLVDGLARLLEEARGK